MADTPIHGIPSPRDLRQSERSWRRSVIASRFVTTTSRVCRSLTPWTWWFNLGGNVEVELEHDDEWAAAQHEFGQWIRGGGRVLAVHTAANSFPDWPEWPALLGGQWVRGTSWHPKRCIATFGKAPGAEDYPVWTGLDVVTVYDERYSDLVVHEGSTPLIRHELSEEWQVMGWAHGDNVIYDGMGHDARSYSSPSHRKFLINEVDWLLS